MLERWVCSWSHAAPFLKTGIMTARFHTSGTVATDNSWLKACASGVARQCFKRLNKSSGKLSGPHDRLLLSLPIAFMTFSLVKKTLSSLTSFPQTLLHTGEAPLSVIPTDAKYLLNFSAFSESSNHILHHWKMKDSYFSLTSIIIVQIQ